MTAKTVLIADDDRELVEALEIRCRELGLEVAAAYDARTALDQACTLHPDVICLDVKMPAGSGLSVCEMLASDGATSSIPVIMLTCATDEETIRRCHAMCAYYVLKSDHAWERLCPILCELLGMESPIARSREGREGPRGTDGPSEAPHHSLEHLAKMIAQGAVSPQVAEGSDGTAEDIVREPSAGGKDMKRRTVLYIEDDAEASGAMRLRLESLGFGVIQAFNGTEGYHLAVAKTPDVILCDYVLPEGDGAYVLRRLRETPGTERIPVIFLTGRPGSDLKRRLYGQGAAGYLTKPVSMEDLVRELGDVLDARLGEPQEAAAR
jgi:CheY-like chemotaxis protein